MNNKEFLSLMDDHLKNMKGEKVTNQKKKVDDSEESQNSSDDYSEYSEEEEKIPLNWDEHYKKEKK